MERKTTGNIMTNRRKSCGNESPERGVQGFLLFGACPVFRGSATPDCGTRISL